MVFALLSEGVDFRGSAIAWKNEEENARYIPASRLGTRDKKKSIISLENLTYQNIE